MTFDSLTNGPRAYLILALLALALYLPGISVFPPPSITVAPSGGAIFLVETTLMDLPSTSTCILSWSLFSVPLNTLTLLKRVTPG